MQVPDSAYLDPKGKRYCVRSFRYGAWALDADLLDAAQRNAERNGEGALAASAHRLQRELGASVSKSMNTPPVIPAPTPWLMPPVVHAPDPYARNEAALHPNHPADQGVFQRWMNGDLEYDRVSREVVGAFRKLAMQYKTGIPLLSMEKALLQILYPDLDVMDPFAAAALAQLTDAERVKLKSLCDARISEMQAQLKNYVPGQTVTFS